MGKKIAIIDDDAEVRDVLKELIQAEFDITSIEFETVDSILENTELDGFDLIISDVHMPTGSGLRLTRELEVLKQDTPLIFISGFVDILPPKDGVLVLRKPLNHLELFGHIKSILNI